MDDLKAALAAATASVAALASEKNALSLDEKALGEKVSSLENTIGNLETDKSDLEKKLAGTEVTAAKRFDEVRRQVSGCSCWIPLMSLHVVDMM